MSDTQSTVGELVTKLHTNIDHINQIIQSLSDESYNRKLEQLAIQRESAIHSLREKRVDALKQILAQRAQEKEETSKKRAWERQLIEDRRIKEWEDILARRKIEDEKWLQNIEAEDQEIEKSRSYEDEEREREREEEERALFEKSENEIETLENEMEKSLEEGRITLRKLDEDRKIINAQIEAALSAPTVIPNISFRSRRQKSRDLSHDQLQKPSNDSNCKIPDTSLAITSLEKSEVENSSFFTEVTEFEKSNSNGKSSIRSSTSSSTEPKELRLVSLMQKEMSEEAIRKRESVFSQKTNSSRGSSSSVDLSKRLSMWRMTSEVISKDLELSGVAPAQEAQAPDEHTNNLLSLFPIKYVHNKTNSRISRSKSIDEKSRISYPLNLKKKVTKTKSESSAFVGQTSHDNTDDQRSHKNDECQISPSNDESEISYAKDSGTELNNRYCETSKINEKSTVLQKISVDSTDIPARKDNQIGEHDICVAGISEQENLNQQLQTKIGSKLNSSSENNFESSKNSPIELPAYLEESVKETNGVSSGLLARNIDSSLELTTEMLHKIESSSKLDYSQEHDDDISALKLAPESIDIKDIPHPVVDTTSLNKGQIKQQDLENRLDNKALHAESHSFPGIFVLHGPGTTTPIISETPSSDNGDRSSSTDIEILNSISPVLFEYKVEKTEEIVSESMNNYLPKSPELSEQNLSLNNASLSKSKSKLEINLRNYISDIPPLTEIHEQEFASETSSHISQSFKEEIINSSVERTVTNEIGTNNIEECLNHNEIREVNYDEPQSHQVLAKYLNSKNVTEFESTEKHLYSDFAEEDSINASEQIVSTQHMSPKEIDVLEEFNNMPAISSDDHFYKNSIEANDLCQIELKSDSFITSLAQENKQTAPIDVQISENFRITSLNAVIPSSPTQDFNKLITHKTTDLIEEEGSTNHREAELSLPQIHNQGETRKFVMLPSNMRYKRSISRDVAALKYVNAGHNMQPDYLSNSQPSTALTSHTDITTEINTTIYKKQISEICSDEHTNNCQMNLTIEENPELENFDLKDDLENCSAIDQEQDNEFTNGRVESPKEIYNNQQIISLKSDVDNLSNHVSSERKSPCESPSRAYILPKKYDQMSTTLSPLLVSELEIPQLGEATSDGIADPENTQKNIVNHDTSSMTDKSNENILIQGPENGDLCARSYTNSSEIILSSEARHSTDETLKNSQFTYIYNEKDIANTYESKVSELNNEHGDSDPVVKGVKEEHLPEQLSVIDRIEDSMLPRENLLYSPIVDLKKSTKRLSYDSSIGRNELKELGTELVTKERKFIDNKTGQNNEPLSRTLSENDLTKMTKKYLDKDIINSHRISSIGSNETTTKEEITSIMDESSPVFKHSISTISSEEPLSPRVEISNTESIISSRQEFYKEDLKEDDQEIKNLTRITDSEDELCNSHLRTDSNTSHDPRNSLVDQANNEYQHEFSIQPLKQPLQNSKALTPTDATGNDQATSVSTASFFQRARALFDNQQKQPRVENYKPVTNRVRPLSGLFNLRGGMLSSKQRFDNNFLAISEDEETNHNVPTSSIAVGINRSHTSMSYSELSKSLRPTSKQRYLRTEQSRLSFYESLQRAATAGTSPMHSPVF